MNSLWFAETVVGSIIGAVITFLVFGVLGWLWARRKLLPLLRKHAPALAAMIEGREE